MNVFVFFKMNFIRSNPIFLTYLNILLDFAVIVYLSYFGLIDLVFDKNLKVLIIFEDYYPMIVTKTHWNILTFPIYKRNSTD